MGLRIVLKICDGSQKFFLCSFLILTFSKLKDMLSNKSNPLSFMIKNGGNNLKIIISDAF